MKVQALHSPKRVKADYEGVYSWVRYHAGFSPRFVTSMISYLGLDHHSKILDPFLGTGTTCLEAKRAGISSSGIELNGFAYFIARARLGWGFGNEELEEYLSDISSNVNGRRYQIVTPDFGQWFADGDPAPSEILSLGAGLKDIANRDLRDFLVAALALSVRAAPRVKAGSNPAWSQTGQPRRGPRPDFRRLFLQNARRMLKDQLTVRTAKPARATVRRADTHTADYGEGISAIISSPPYLSRLDYVMAHRIENDLLAALGYQSDPDLLRTKLVGGVVKNGRSAPKLKAEWGETCLRVLQSVKSHPSKGSLTYYYPLMANYFLDMFECMERFKEALATDGALVLVAQSSYYKDIEVPLPKILRTMAKRAGFAEARTIFRVDVTNVIGNMDPEQKAYVPQKTLHEDVILALPQRL
ncbi:MAG: hypothetical protein KGI38_05980 [Thaumarchaeota archaeon]|nr:hypothetical protein [Nitrososphaerota archaeon]